MKALKQLSVLLRKQFILYRRYWVSTLFQTVLTPIILLLLLFLLQKAFDAKNFKSNLYPESFNLDPFNKCYGSDCVTLMYTPKTVQTDAIIQSLLSKNKERGIELEQSNSLFDTFDFKESPDVISVPSTDFIYNYTLINPNKTLYGVAFTVNSNVYEYQIWFNHTLSRNGSSIFNTQLMSLSRGLDEAILSVSSGQPVNIDISLKDFPLIGQEVSGDGMVTSAGALFFFCSQMVIFINALNGILTEKENKLRAAMQMMGLSNSSYWASWLLSCSILVFFNALTTCIFGIFFGFKLFTQASFAVTLITFFLFGLGMLSLAFFLTTLVRQVRAGVLLGIFVFIVGLFFQTFLFRNQFSAYIWYDSSTSPSIVAVFQLLPWFNFGKVFFDINSLTAGRLDVLTQEYIQGPGFSWNNLYSKLDEAYLPRFASGPPDAPPPVFSWYWMLFDITLYGLLAIYLDNVIRDEFGNALPFYYPFMPSYWLKRSKKVQPMEIKERADDDEDVLKEREKALDTSKEYPLRIVHLRKEYKKYWWKSDEDKLAVVDTCLALEEGKLLALLGQNGAGKSTSINILVGLTHATSGDAFIHSYSCATQRETVRDLIGVCPQHDILFHDLTAQEHIELYGGIKGLTKEQVNSLVDERLEAVRLLKVKDKYAGTYSGGMKRRLSLVIATIGDPKVVFLDEPTTGMDPVNRRHVWSFIEKFKKGRVIVLTTHAMEEADVLGDQIGIMSQGRLRAYGNGVHLKGKFGGGYRLALVGNVKEKVTEIAPTAILEDDSAGALIYHLPAESVPQFAIIVKEVEEWQKAGLINGWSLSQTTLEEVFLKIVRDEKGVGALRRGSAEQARRNSK